MSVQFPKAVIWDGSKSCHIVIHVRRQRGDFVYACLDCVESSVYPLGMLDPLREYLRGRDDGQVLLWIEDNG